MLARVLERFQRLNLAPVVAIEYEFYLVDRERTAAGQPQPPRSPLTGRREFRLSHVWVAVDTGKMVAPDVCLAQIQSGVIFGLTAALFDQITFKNGAVEQRNFTDYRVMQLAETPPIDVRFLDSGAAPGGIGEPGVPCMAPALANALFAATGKRLRALPVAAQGLTLA